jgi:hypothetical protein
MILIAILWQTMGTIVMAEEDTLSVPKAQIKFTEEPKKVARHVQG